MDTIFWNGGIKIGIMARYIGPYKIAHWLRKHGYQAQVIEFANAASEKYLYKLTKHFITPDTKILAISTTFLSIHSYEWKDGSKRHMPESIINVLRLIKTEHPGIKVVLGGYKAELVDDFGGLIDSTIMSYTTASEDIFLEYIDHLVKGTPPPLGQITFPRLSKKDSTIFNVKMGGSRMWYNSARNPVYNIETDDFRFTKNDCILPGEPLPLDVSRGCIFACRFCQYPHLGKGKLDYIRGMHHLETELLYNYENFGTTNYYMLDDTFNDTEIKLQSFYDMTQRLPFKISYSSYLRADLLDRFPNMPHLLQESGLFGAYHGIESLHPEASNLVGKAWSGKRAKDFIPKLYHDIWGGKVPQHLNFIVGITKDTQENIKDTVDWYKTNNLHSIHFDYLRLFGSDNNSSIYTIQSEFDKNAEKYGYTFVESFSGDSRSWYNDNWDTKLAEKVAAQANKQVYDSRRLHIWALPALEWYGYTKEFLMKVKHKDVPFGQSFIMDITIKRQREYWSKLLEIK